MKIVLFCLLNMIAAMCFANAQSQSFVLNNVLLPNFKTQQLEAVNVAVENGKIANIVPLHTPLQHRDVRDGQGKVLMPAMIDMHSHSMGNSSLDRSDYQYIGIRGTANAMLYAGVHGWLDLYSDEKDILSYRDNRYASSRNEAFVFAAGPCFTVPGGHCDFGARNRLINSPEQARNELIDLSKSKPNVVKVVYDHNQKKPTLDEATFKAFIDKANELGIKSVVHVGTWQDIKTASEFGASAVTHLPDDKMPEGMEDLLAKNGTVVIPTVAVMTELLYMHRASEQKLQTSVVGLPLTKTLVDESLLQDYPVSARHPRFLAYLEKSAEQQLESNMQDAVLRLHARGVTLLIGSDAANLAMFQGVGFHRELFHLARFGLSPWQLFKAATLDAYEFLGIDWQIKVGADAHFTLQDPAIFTDVAKSTEVQQVYLYGRLVEREALLDYAKPGFIQYAKLFLGFER